MLLKDAQKKLNQHRRELIKLGARAISLFGSITRSTTSHKSDVDILVDFDSKRGIFEFISLKNYLEELLKCDVDLVTKRALHPALKKRILQEAKHVY